MTTEEWKIIETELNDKYRPVRLKCDEYEISLSIANLGKFRLCIAVYVRDQESEEFMMKGQWLTECEISKKFYQKKGRNVHSAKFRKEALSDLRKIKDKEFVKKQIERIEKKYMSMHHIGFLLNH